ncbi:MAG: sensor histidine kinase [Caulobacteraceae bacterium]
MLAASTSFDRTFGVAAVAAPARAVFEVGDGEWDRPELRGLLKAALDGQTEVETCEMDLHAHDGPTRRLVLDARKLDYSDTANIRVLLAASDVTDARLAEKLKNDMLREKAVLLQELQHRVANSLQIIASVLLQSARRVNSDESRRHLYDAHSRVMSVAAVQQQLAATRLGDVHLRDYFTELCKSIGASMIRDHSRLSLEVSADDSVASPDVSACLGLMVTELVINALKHAFPGRRAGAITVDYRARGPAWTLAVTDDGVGFPVDPASAKSGLGTSIIEALANQLDARVEISHGQPGTSVSIIHG